MTELPKEITVPVHDDPSLSEVADRAKMAWLGQLMEDAQSHIPSVAKRLGCTDANVRKAIRYLVSKYGGSEDGSNAGGSRQESLEGQGTRPE